MNLIPKEIKTSLDDFSKLLKNISQGTTCSNDFNYSQILKDTVHCICNARSYDCKTCPKVPSFELFLNSQTKKTNVNVILTIKNIDIYFRPGVNTMFNLMLFEENDKMNTTISKVLFKGIISNNHFAHNLFSSPITISIPTKLVVKLVLINQHDNELWKDSDKILNMGVVNFGLTV